MDSSDAIKKVEKDFKDLENLGTQFTREELVELFHLTKNKIRKGGVLPEKQTINFLHYLSKRFDRFCSPKVTTSQEGYDLFSEIVDVYKECQDNYENTGYFEIHRLKWFLFQKVHCKPFTEIDNKVSDDVREGIKKIKSPLLNIDSYYEVKKELENILNGIENNEVSTYVVTSLPVTPVIKETIITTEWNGIKTKIKINPQLNEVENTIANPGGDAKIIPLTNSQWQHASSEIRIIFSCLVDHSRKSNPLAFKPHSSPFDGWPSIFNIVFEIIDKVIWNLRVKKNNKELPGRWYLKPNDLGPIDWRLKIKAKEVSRVIKDPPGSQSILTNDLNGLEELELDISSVPWYLKCKYLAKSYLEAGETNEAKFWLNVGIESYFEEQMDICCKKYSIEKPDEEDSW